MSQVSASKIVEVVLHLQRVEASNTEIQNRLELLGVPTADTSIVIESVMQGFKSGTAAVVIGIGATAGIRFGANPIFDKAFQQGKKAMRFTSPLWIILRSWLTWLFAALAIFAVAYALRVSQ